MTQSVLLSQVIEVGYSDKKAGSIWASIYSDEGLENWAVGIDDSLQFQERLYVPMPC